MARMMRFAVLLLAIVPSFAAEDSNFALWTPAAIKGGLLGGAGLRTRTPRSALYCLAFSPNAVSWESWVFEHPQPAISGLSKVRALSSADIA
jgi:hypothetical protein